MSHEGGVPREAAKAQSARQEIHAGSLGLGVPVTVEPSDKNPHAEQDDYGWGGAASTHYWLSPHDNLIVVTMVQRWQYSLETEVTLKPVIYDAITGDGTRVR